MRALLIAVAVAVSASAGAQDAGSEPAPPPALLSVAVLDLVADPGEETLAKNLAGLITAQLATHPLKVVGQEEVRTLLGFEKARAAAGCTDDTCLVELGGALGVKLLVHGALGKVGKTYLMRLTLADLVKGTAIHRAVRKEESEDALIGAAESAADELASHMGLAPQPANVAVAIAPPAIAPTVPPDVPEKRSFVLNLKLGNTFGSLNKEIQAEGSASGFDVDRANLSFDLEGDYYFTDQLAGFLQIGVVLGSAVNAENQDVRLTIVPAAIGAKLAFMPGQRWNPYASLGVGGGFVSAIQGARLREALFSFNATGGVEYVPWSHLGFNIEASFNLANLNFAEQESLQLSLLHLNFGVIYLW